MAPRIHAVRLGTCSRVANAGTATLKAPQPKPRKHPSNIKTCIALLRQTPAIPDSRTSGIQFREAREKANPIPPVKIKIEQTRKGDCGYLESESAVATTGPST